MPQKSFVETISGRDLAKALNSWLASAEGKHCMEGRCDGQYLRNRLRSAFLAGVSAGAELIAEAGRAALKDKAKGAT